MTDDRRYASLKTAAEYLDLKTVDSIRDAIAKGLIHGYKFGPKTLRVDLNEIDAVMRPVPTAK